MENQNHCELYISKGSIRLDLDGAMIDVESVKNLPNLPKQKTFSGRFIIIKKGFIGAFLNRKKRKQITIIELPKN